MIRTPDQRLRVFISSTLIELAPERKVVKAAIEKLRLIPVLFEGGARPHAPQDLYRAYLDQSQVFIGIYGASYGWVGPDMDISGLEDEFRLSGSLPRLIYVKNSVSARDPRLQGMLDRLKSDGSVSFQKFDTPEELGEQVQSDLALLFSERFGANAPEEGSVLAPMKLPVLRGDSVGREEDVRKLQELLLHEGNALVTVTGPGGTGKSRICLLLGHKVHGRFKGGAVFVPLASISDPGLVAQAIASALGAYDNGRRSAVEVLKDVISDKELLLVLDNFEQVLPAALLLNELLEHCPRLKILVSSRSPLHVRGEQVYPLAPLAGPVDAAHQAREEILACPSVDLFVRRAREASANLVLDDANVQAIAALCIKLDGLPLAIELAAAHTRLLSPVSLQQRMDNALGLLTRGAHDLPERQRTIRATIAWSHDLLSEQARVLFRRLGTLLDRFTLADVHAVAGAGGGDDETIAALEELMDHGLVRALPSTAGSIGEVFTMLHVVRQFAQEALDASGERPARTFMHAEHFSAVAAGTEKSMVGVGVAGKLERMDIAGADLRAAFWYWIATGDRTSAWRMIGDRKDYWTKAGTVSEALKWMEAAGVYPEKEAPELTDLQKGRAFATAGMALTLGGEYTTSTMMLAKAVSFLEKMPGTTDLDHTLTFLGIAQVSHGDAPARATLERALELSVAIGDDANAGFALTFLCETYLAAGDLEGAAAVLDRAKPLVDQFRSHPPEALYLLQRANVDLLLGEFGIALQHYERSVSIFNSARMLPFSGWSMLGVGYTQLCLDRTEQAMGTFMATLERARFTNDSGLLSACLMSFALVAIRWARLEEAAQLIGAGEGIAASIGFRFWTNNHLQQEEAKRALRDRLTPTVFDQQTARGRALSQEAAIAFALELGGVKYAMPRSG